MSVLSRGSGSAIIITGTSVGAGMLAIPATVAGKGFWIATILLVIVWFIMFSTAILIAEINLSMPDGSNFNYMAEQTMGKIGKNITWILYLLLLYALLSSYLSGGTEIIKYILDIIHIRLPQWINSIIFLLILGYFVYKGTKAIDYSTAFLMLIKMIVFLSCVLVILPYIRVSYINKMPIFTSFTLTTIPILITSFGFHHIIPTLRSYLKSNEYALKKAIFIGSIIPLFIYIIWIFVILGSVPFSQHSDLLQNSQLNTSILNYFNSNVVSNCSYIFETVALATSFLGVALGLLDFNYNSYNLNKKLKYHHFIVLILTFLPPLIFANIYKNGFRILLGYASIFVSILLIGIPAIMAWKVREKNNTNSLISKIYLIIILIISVSIVFIEIGIPPLKYSN